MNSLKTFYAGLELKNPIIASSSNKTATAEQNLELERAGVGAIVLKSLFEENIALQEDNLITDTTHTEGVEYLGLYLRNGAIHDYLQLIHDTKKLCSIPVIASINCYSIGEWIDVATLIEQSGADALELNIMGIEIDPFAADGSFELRNIEIVQRVKAVVSLPVIVKLGSNLSNPIALIARLEALGVAAVVLFNRMYQTDINVNTMEYVQGHIFSEPGDLALPLRWTAIASGKLKMIDFALSGGVHAYQDIVKAILVGASAVQICSVLYQHGNDWIKPALKYLSDWEQKLHFFTINDFKGLMNINHIGGDEHFQRTQFLRFYHSLK